MKTKTLTFVVIFLVLVGALVTAARRTPPQIPQQQPAELEEKEKSGRIKLAERVQLAKARGKNKIAIPGTVSLYISARSPEEQYFRQFFHSRRARGVLALDAALDRLTGIDERKSRIVELRFFGGLNAEETAEVLSVHPATVRRDWTVARAWLHREISRELAS